MPGKAKRAARQASNQRRRKLGVPGQTGRPKATAKKLRRKAGRINAPIKGVKR
jgi:hypothetical protein